VDSGDTLAVVATRDGALDGLREALQAGLPEALGELSLVASDELGEVSSEEPLERARASLAVGPGRRRVQTEGELVGQSASDAALG